MCRITRAIVQFKKDVKWGEIMKRLYSAIEGLTLGVTLLTGAAFGADLNNSQSLRKNLMDSMNVGSVYAIDDYSTMVTPAKEDYSGLVEKEINIFTKKDVNVTSIEKRTHEGKTSFIITRSAKEPFMYKNPNIPAYDAIKAPASNRVEASYRGIDMFEYVYALCNKENGTPVFVVPKRYGRFSRLTDGGALSAFNYLMTAGEGATWVAACVGGEKKFFVENEMTLSGENNTYLFYSGRGLEGLGYVKEREDSEYIAALAASGMASTEGGTAEKGDFLEDMALQMASLEMDLVKSYGEEKYIGTYYRGYGSESCKKVSITRAGKGGANMLLKEIARSEEAAALREIGRLSPEQQSEKVSYYRVCDNRASSLENIDGGVIDGIRNLFAGINLGIR